MKSNLLHAHLTTQFTGAAPERLYEVYTDAREHALATGQPAAIDAREGGDFSAYGGYLTGRFIRLVPGQLVVQYWPPSISRTPTRTRSCPLPSGRMSSGTRRPSWF